MDLHVTEAYDEDVLRCRIRIGASTQQRLGLEHGDIIQIEGKMITSAIFHLDPEDNKGTIRIDGLTRRNAGVDLNETVRISKIRPPSARNVILRIVMQNIKNRETLVKLTPEFLRGYSTSANSIIMMPFENATISFSVKSTDPEGVIIISKETKIIIE